MLNVVGGAPGVVTSTGLATLLANWAEQPRFFDAASAWLVLAIAMGLNLAFAAIPARGRQI